MLPIHECVQANNHELLGELLDSTDAALAADVDTFKNNQRAADLKGLDGASCLILAIK